MCEISVSGVLSEPGLLHLLHDDEGVALATYDLMRPQEPRGHDPPLRMKAQNVAAQHPVRRGLSRGLAEGVVVQQAQAFSAMLQKMRSGSKVQGPRLARAIPSSLVARPPLCASQNPA